MNWEPKEDRYRKTYFPGRTPSLKEFRRRRGFRKALRIAGVLLVLGLIVWVLYLSVRH